jgi:hypothetical protein
VIKLNAYPQLSPIKNETKHLRFSCAAAFGGLATLEMTAYLAWIGGELAALRLRSVTGRQFPSPMIQSAPSFRPKGDREAASAINLIIHEYFIFRYLKLFWGKKRISRKYTSTRQEDSLKPRHNKIAKKISS